jgi:site-specific recombinase XerD
MTTAIKHFSVDQYATIKTHVESHPSPAHTAVEILIRTGIRQDELVRLEASSFDLANRLIKVKAAKGSLDRAVPIAEECLGRVRALVLQLGGRSLGQLLSSSRSKDTQTRQVRRIFERVQREALGEKAFSAHATRHSWALKIYLGTGKDLLKTQKAMGHKNINSTVRYVQYLQMQELAPEILKAVG